MSDRIKLIKPEAVAVEIPPELLDQLNGCRDTVNGNVGRNWTTAEDAAILAFYRVKRKDELARVFGVCTETLRKRYNELTEGTHGV